MCSNRQGAHMSWGMAERAGSSLGDVSGFLPVVKDVVSMSLHNHPFCPHTVFEPCVSCMQGYLWKKGQLRRNWSERWFMLKPSALSYYMSEERKEKKGSITLDKHCCVEVQPGLTAGATPPKCVWGSFLVLIPLVVPHLHGSDAIPCPLPAGAARPGWEEVHVLREDLIPHV